MPTPRLLLTLTLAVLAGALCHERTDAMDAPVLAARDVMPLVVQHQQGWGRLGLDVAAHAPGSDALPLRIGETDYAHGIGTHAPGEMWLSLEGRYAWFEAEVGVQRQPQDAGTVTFQVYGDDELLFDSGVLGQADGARPVRVPVEGVQDLRLVCGDGGDGVVCDCANWVNLRLTPSDMPAPAAAVPVAPVNIVPFGRVLTWNPFVKDGTHALRTEEFPARDLFPGTPVRPENGSYAIPMIDHPHADIGAGCIGVEWLEQRRLRKVALTFTGNAPAPEGVAVEYWLMTPDLNSTPGVSRWQGHWERLCAPIALDGRTWSVDFPMTENGWQRPKTMKVRWVFPRDLRQLRIEQLSAWSDTSWKDVDITLHALNADADATGSVGVYNGRFLDEGVGADTTTWSLSEPLRLRVRMVVDRPWTRAERTVLRLDLPGQDFGIAVGDVMDEGCVYVRAAGIAALPTDREGELADLLAATDGKTILEQVRTMPDQTFAQAIEHVHRPEGDYGPTLLSLAHGNEKFLLQRSGSIGFDAPGKYARQKRHLDVSWEGQSNETIQRHLDGGWKPIPIIAHEQDGVRVTQTTFVAPTGSGPGEGQAAWYDGQPLCVADYTLENPTDTARPVALRFSLRAEGAASVAAHARGLVFTVDGTPCALLDATAAGTLTASGSDGGATLSGTLAPGASVQAVLLLPGWDTAPDALPGPDAAAGLIAAARAHWDAAMAGSADITTPDPMLNDLIRASRVHCMLAARNEEGVRIAPWIGSIDYGPLESEAHSLVRGMAFLGHDDFARRGLDFFINRYNDAGYLTTGYTVIGTGWHLWALGEYYALSDNRAWLRANAPEVSRVCDWILAQREKTRQNDVFGVPYPEHGLMPPGVLADWGVYSHYFYLNGNYHAGLHWAGRALADIGWDGAEGILENAAAFRDDIERAFHYVQGQAPVLPLRDGTWVPAYPTQLYCPMPVADLYVGDDAGRSWCYDVELGAHHLVPMGVLKYCDPAVDDMMNHMEDVQFLESGWFYYPKEGNHEDWFNLGGFAKVQPFYARNAEVCAMRDDVKPFIRNYFNAVVSLLNREDLSLWEHFMNGAFNKTHETGYFLHQSRLMFVMERGDGLWLAPFTPEAWLENGQTIDVRDVPTFFGPVSYTITSNLDEGYVRAEIDPPARETRGPIALRLRCPGGKAVKAAEVTGGRLRAITSDVVYITPDGSAPITVVARF